MTPASHPSAATSPQPRICGFVEEPKKVMLGAGPVISGPLRWSCSLRNEANAHAKQWITAALN
jgi:hypothetical protein